MGLFDQMFRWLVVVLSLVCLGVSQVTFPLDCSSVSSYYLAGDPIPTCDPATNTIRMQDQGLNRQNLIWMTGSNNRGISISRGFSVSFSFLVGQSLSGDTADGFAFVIQTQGPDASVPGVGGGIGYDGLVNSVAIEFDYYLNGDTDATVDRVEVHSIPFSANSPSNTAVVNGMSAGPLNMKDEVQHDVQINYVAPVFGQSTLTVTYDGVDIINGNFRLEDYVSLLDGARAFVGFTSSTGGATSTLDIFGFSSVASIGGDPHVENMFGEKFDLEHDLKGKVMNFYRSDVLDVNIQVDPSGMMTVNEFSIHVVKDQVDYVFEGRIDEEGFPSLFFNGSAVSVGSDLPDWISIHQPNHFEGELKEFTPLQNVQVDIDHLISVSGGRLSDQHGFFNLMIQRPSRNNQRGAPLGLVQIQQSKRSESSFDDLVVPHIQQFDL